MDHSTTYTEMGGGFMLAYYELQFTDNIDSSKHVEMLVTDQNNSSVTIMPAPISVWFISQAPIPYYGIK